MPTWEELARRVHGTPQLVVAKMDGDLNDSPFPEEFRWSARRPAPRTRDWPVEGL